MIKFILKGIIMKKIIFVSFISLSSLIASPAVMGGITYNFGGSDSNSSLTGAGATVKVLSTSKEKKPVLAAGVSYYPWASEDKKFGVDVSAGYNFKKGAVMAGWDFLKNQPSVSLGYNKEINIKEDDNKFGAGIQDARCAKSKTK